MENKTETNTLLDELIAKREKFLQEKPHMVEFQNEIDRLLDNAGSQENRMAVLGIMIGGKLSELKTHMCLLGEMLKNEEI